MDNLQLQPNTIAVSAIVLNNPMDVYNFAIGNGKVVFITEDTEPELNGLPNKLQASVLLPPYEAISFELDEGYAQAQMIYENWLKSKECMDYINLITLAIMKGIPIALYFGKEAGEMKFPGMFTNFFLKTTGIQFGYGIYGGYIDKTAIPYNLALFLDQSLIDIPTFFFMMPDNCDICPMAIPFLTAALHPPLKPGSSLVDLNNYFKGLIKEIHGAGKYLFNPIVGE